MFSSMLKIGSFGLHLCLYCSTVAILRIIVLKFVIPVVQTKQINMFCYVFASLSLAWMQSKGS